MLPPDVFGDKAWEITSQWCQTITTIMDTLIWPFWSQYLYTAIQQYLNIAKYKDIVIKMVRLMYPWSYLWQSLWLFVWLRNRELYVLDRDGGIWSMIVGCLASLGGYLSSFVTKDVWRIHPTDAVQPTIMDDTFSPSLSSYCQTQLPSKNLHNHGNFHFAMQYHLYLKEFASDFLQLLLLLLLQLICKSVFSWDLG